METTVCQGECSHSRLKQKQKQIMEKMSIFRAATHHASCVDGGVRLQHSGSVPGCYGRQATQELPVNNVGNYETVWTKGLLQKM